MADAFEKRLDYIDVRHAQSVLETWTKSSQQSRDMLTSEPGKLEQRRYSSLHSALEHKALGLYALGHPLEETRELLRQSVQVYEQVLRLRGTEEVFPVLVVTLDTRLSPSDPNYAKQEPAHPPGTKDYSLGNAGDSYRTAFIALIAGEPEAARRIALKAEDPPKAEWVGYHKYATCTINEQRLAYALHNLYESDEEGALKLVKMIGPTRHEHNEVLEQATMWKGLLQNDASQFLSGLVGLLHWHNRTARHDAHMSQNYLCVPGLGLCALALRRGLIKLDQLPRDNPFLPEELLPQV